MAKVFATLIENNEVVLKTWSSAAAFSKVESWLDDKFIYIATSSDFKGSFACSAMFSDELDESVDRVTGNNFNVIKTDNERTAYQLMFDARKAYLKK